MKCIEPRAKFARLSQCKKNFRVRPIGAKHHPLCKEFDMSARAARVALASLLLPLLAAPAVSLADSTDAMDACVRAFLASEVAKDRKVVVEKDFESVPRPLALSGLYKIEVVATGRESGKQVARIVCQADTKGTIVALNGKPTSAVAAVAQTD
jgi:hypothetical protein